MALTDLLKRQLSLTEELDSLKSDRHDYMATSDGLPSIYTTMKEVGGDGFAELESKLADINSRINTLTREYEDLKMDIDSNERKDTGSIDDHQDGVEFSEKAYDAGQGKIAPRKTRRTARSKEQITHYWKDRIKHVRPQFSQIFNVPQFMRVCGDDRAKRIKNTAVEVMGKWEYEFIKDILKKGGIA